MLNVNESQPYVHLRLFTVAMGQFAQVTMECFFLYLKRGLLSVSSETVPVITVTERLLQCMSTCMRAPNGNCNANCLRGLVWSRGTGEAEQVGVNKLIRRRCRLQGCQLQTSHPLSESLSLLLWNQGCIQPVAKALLLSSQIVNTKT